MHHPKYLIVGPVVPETIRMPRTGRYTDAIGGIAGQIATSLANREINVSVHASLGHGDQGTRIRTRLTSRGIHIIDGTEPAGWANLTINTNGDLLTENGYWPPAPSFTPLIAPFMDEAHFLILSTQRKTETINTYLAEANHRNLPTMLVVSTESNAHTILNSAAAPKTIIAMNVAEYHQVQLQSCKHEAQHILQAVNTAAMLVTSGHEGWQLHRTDRPTLHGQAPPAPHETSFVGCGDYAAAGLCRATAHDMTDEFIITTINDHIETKIREWHQGT